MDDGFKDPDKIKDALVYYEPGHEDQLQLHECILLLASLGAAAIFIPCDVEQAELGGPDAVLGRVEELGGVQVPVLGADAQVAAAIPRTPPRVPEGGGPARAPSPDMANGPPPVRASVCADTGGPSFQRAAALTRARRRAQVRRLLRSDALVCVDRVLERGAVIASGASDGCVKVT